MGRREGAALPLAGPRVCPHKTPTSFVWGSANSAQLLTAQAWSKVSVYNFIRPAQEMHWRGSQHRVSLQLRPQQHAVVQVEQSAQLEFTPLLALSFTPAGVPIRTVMDAGDVIGVLQEPETYADIAPELVNWCHVDLEPIWSMADPVAEKLIRRLLIEAEEGFVDNLMASTLNSAIAIQIARHFAGAGVKLLSPAQLSPGRLARVIDYIESNLGGPLTLDGVAAEACLSPFHFSRSFKRSLGIGLHQFVIQRRITHAKQLIRYSKRPLAEIGLDVGFDSQASFSARFKREVGMSPGHFRKVFQ